MSDDTPPSSRWQELWDKTLPVLAGGLIAGIFAIAGSYFATKFQTTAEVNSKKIEEQQKVFARIMGRKFTTEQLYVSRYEASIYSDYEEALWKRAGAPKDSFDLQEAQRWQHRAEDLVFDIVKSNQALFEDIGTVRAVFPDTPRLRELCDQVYRLPSIKIASPPTSSTSTIEQLTQWKDEARRQLDSIVQTKYGKPIDDLTVFLLTQLH
jgi:hypothetical protein